MHIVLIFQWYEFYYFFVSDVTFWTVKMHWLSIFGEVPDRKLDIFGTSKVIKSNTFSFSTTSQNKEEKK